MDHEEWYEQFYDNKFDNSGKMNKLLIRNKLTKLIQGELVGVSLFNINSFTVHQTSPLRDHDGSGQKQFKCLIMSEHNQKHKHC